MTTQSTPAAVIVTPADSLVIGAYGDEFRFHLTSEHTNGKFTLFTDITPPGGGPPPHYHANEDETFTVIEGQADQGTADGRIRTHWKFVRSRD